MLDGKRQHHLPKTIYMDADPATLGASQSRRHPT